MHKIKKLFPVLLIIMSIWNILFVGLSFVEALYKGNLGVDPILYNPNMKLILPFVLLIIFAIGLYFSYSCYYDFKEIYRKWEIGEEGQKKELAQGGYFYVTKFFYVQGIMLFVTLLGGEQISNIILMIAGL